MRSFLKQPMQLEPTYGEDQDENEKPLSQSQSLSHSFRRILDSDDDLDNDDMAEGSQEQVNNAGADTAPKRFIDSDDDEEDESVVLQKKRQKIVDDEDDE
jgi:hypothetical protein